MSKRLALPIAALLVAVTLSAQERLDIGLTLGGNYYYGDFNEAIPLQSPALGAGLVLRFDLGPFYAIRASALYSSVSGEHGHGYYLPGTPTPFNGPYLDAQVMGELHFIRFDPMRERRKQLAPFVCAGVGIAQIDGALTPTIPFGVGVKYSPLQRHTVALEWRLLKTATDNIDGYTPINHNAISHNNDWISFVGLVYTYRLHSSEICPVYK